MDVKPYTAYTTWDLIHILGLSLSLAAKKFPFVTGITGGFQSLYLYTDLVEDQLVVDFVVPLLCCVSASRNNNEIITATYDSCTPC